MTQYSILVPDKLFLPAESECFDGSIELESLDAGPDVYTFQGPLFWSATVQNTGDALLVTGSVRGTASTSCARCLEDFSLDIAGDIEGYFLLNGASAPQGMDDDEFDVLPECHEIDMKSLAIAAILIELPLVPLCKEDCLGLCSHCGANLNDSPCECSSLQSNDESNGDNNLPRMSDGRVSPFASLKDFKFE